MALLHDKRNNTLAGMAGILHQEIENKRYVEVAYGLLHKYWGQGLATEAATFCRDFAFENKMSDMLVSIIHPNNVNSHKVAKRNGMTHRLTLNYKGHKSYIFKITYEEWRNFKRPQESQE